MKDTLICNFLAGPSAGKSTYALGTAYRLKADRWLAEYVPEYAKELTWTKNFNTLSKQLHVTAQQYSDILVPYGQVDVVVTDSPFIIGLLYPDIMGHVDKEFENWLIKVFKTFNNLNIFLERNPEGHHFQQEGRNQTEEQAKEKDEECLKLLDRHDIPYHRIVSGRKDETLADIMALIKERINAKQP